MKVLWLCNAILKDIAERYGIKGEMGISWIDSMIQRFRDADTVNPHILFPSSCIPDREIRESGVVYYPFCSKSRYPHVYDSELEEYFTEILKRVRPDIIHIFGTEFPHALAMMKAVTKMGLNKKTVVSLQGLCSVIERHYYAFLPIRVIYGYTVRDLIKRDNIYQQRIRFRKRGQFEVEALRMSFNVIGRTEWDYACTMRINDKARYFKCDEIMRKSFYQHRWNIQECEKHSIFISQSYYPLKGFHILLEAAADLLVKYPDIHIYTTGVNIMKGNHWKETSYARYLRKQIAKYRLEKNITFLGPLDEKKMCRRFLKSHVFVSASSIENSSNSLSEAMLLGVPCVASDVGGTASLIRHNQDGFLYQADAPYMLMHYIDRIFSDDWLAQKISESAKAYAQQIHDAEKSCARLVEIYEEISK